MMLIGEGIDERHYRAPSDADMAVAADLSDKVNLRERRRK